MTKNIPYLLSALLALVSLAACSPLSTINALTPSDSYELTQDIAYGTLERQKLDVYVPSENGQGRPAVVFFYGGRWSFGSKDNYLFAAEALTSRGFAVVVPDYRVYPEVVFPAFVEDGAQAVAWAREHIEDYGGDPKHLFVMGHSAGAHIAALLALDERYLRAVGGSSEWLSGMIGLAGPYDFLPLTSEDLQAIFGPPARYPESQPINFVDGNVPPLLLLHGKFDATVAPKNTLSLTAKVRTQGGEVKAILYDTLNHTSLIGALSGTFRFLAPVLNDVTAFIREHATQTDDI